MLNLREILAGIHHNQPKLPRKFILMNLNTVICGDSAHVLKTFPDECIDLTVTSPPYDNLRTYHGYVFDFETIAKQLFRVTKKGGVVVWVVGDATVDGSETGTSFRQALYFMECGFNLHDTMIWNKGGFTATGSLVIRYASVFDYMFILSKDTLKTFNPIKDRMTKNPEKFLSGNIRGADGSLKIKRSNEGKRYNEFSQRFNIWNIAAPGKDSDKRHPAIFPSELARDHIISWSNEGDTVLDCFAGSGTTLKMAKMLKRNYVGIEISSEYVQLIEKRLRNTPVQESFLIHSNEVTLR